MFHLTHPASLCSFKVSVKVNKGSSFDYNANIWKMAFLVSLWNLDIVFQFNYHNLNWCVCQSIKTALLQNSTTFS